MSYFESRVRCAADASLRGVMRPRSSVSRLESRMSYFESRVRCAADASLRGVMRPRSSGIATRPTIYEIRDSRQALRFRYFFGILPAPLGGPVDSMPLEAKIELLMSLAGDDREANPA